MDLLLWGSAVAFAGAPLVVKLVRWWNAEAEREKRIYQCRPVRRQS